MTKIIFNDNENKILSSLIDDINDLSIWKYQKNNDKVLILKNVKNNYLLYIKKIKEEEEYFYNIFIQIENSESILSPKFPSLLIKNFILKLKEIKDKKWIQ